MAQSLSERSKRRLRLEIAKQMAGIPELAPQRKRLHLASEPTDADLSPTLQDITTTSESTSRASPQVDDFEGDLYVSSPDSSAVETLDFASETTDAVLSPTTTTSEISRASPPVHDFEGDLYVTSPDSSPVETLDFDPGNVSDDSNDFSVPESSDLGTCSSEVLYSESDDSEGDSSVDDFAQASSSTTPCPRKPMFPGSKITPNEFNVALLSLGQRHNLTYACLTAILQLLALMIPSPCSLPTSNHVLTKMFVDYPKETITHRCCGFCTRLLIDGESCARLQCRSAKEPDAKFVEIPLDAQLRERFEGMLHGISPPPASPPLPSPPEL